MVLENFFWEYKNKIYLLSYFLCLTALAFFVYLQSLGVNVKIIIVLLSFIWIVIIICMLINMVSEYALVKTGKRVSAKIHNIYVPDIKRKIVYRHGVELFENIDGIQPSGEDYIYIICYVDNFGITQKIEQKFFAPFVEVEGKCFWC